MPTPYPDVDFNGAECEIHFHGNLNIGDGVHVQLHTAEADQSSQHWCEIFRQSDGEKPADVFTEKTWPSECTRR